MTRGSRGPAGAVPVLSTGWLVGRASQHAPRAATERACAPRVVRACVCDPGDRVRTEGMASVKLRLALAAVSTGFTALFAAGLVIAAALVTPPLAAVPAIALACIGAPMAATFELARAFSAARDPHDRLRRELELLPETPHPLGY